MMYFHFLIEDESGTVLVKELMKKITNQYADITCKYISFRGIGGFPKSGNAQTIKTQKLLNDLCPILCGLMQSLQGIPAAIIIIVDNDKRNTDVFLDELKRVAEKAAGHITTPVDHVFCIAIEEIEAWMLGDTAAIRAAYPGARLPLLRQYKQDSICGTWEVMADVVYHGGLKKMKKEAATYWEKGKIKAEWAKKIGPHMKLDSNRSPSFNRFIAAITSRIDS